MSAEYWIRSKWLRAWAVASLVGKLVLLASWIASADEQSVHGDRRLRADHDASRVVAVTRVGFTVSDLERSVAFFEEVLGFERVDEPIGEVEHAGSAIERLTGVFAARTRSARLRLGREEIELTEFLAPSTGRRMPEDSAANDLWFQHVAIVVSDMETAYARLRSHRVRHASAGPQRLPDWNPNAGGIEAFYFRDPDGHFLELIEYPPGKGDTRWQSDETLFLGIDHTAIAVADTETSLAYYRDRLGLAVAGTSENHGIEQERLNGVFGARLRITGLRTAGGGPGIELLEYLSPATGRARPRDARANDLLSWHVDLHVTGVDEAYRALLVPSREEHSVTSSVDSPAVVRIAGLGKAFTAVDPDGHRLRFVESSPGRSASAPPPPRSKSTRFGKEVSR